MYVQGRRKLLDFGQVKPVKVQELICSVQSTLSTQYTKRTLSGGMPPGELFKIDVESQNFCCS